MKIAFILNNFLPQSIGGTEMYVFHLASKLKSRIDCCILIPNPSLENVKEYTYEDLMVIEFPSFRPIQNLPENLFIFQKILRENQIQIAHFHEFHSENHITPNHIRAAKELGCKVILTFHLAGYTCFTGTLMKNKLVQCNGLASVPKCTTCKLCHLNNNIGPITSNIILLFSWFLGLINITPPKKGKLFTALEIYSQTKKHISNIKIYELYSDTIITVANWYKKVLVTNGFSEKKLFFIPQLIPHKNLTETEIKTIAKSKIKLLFIGRIHESKGLHQLIHAFLEVNSPNLELDIFGHINDSEYYDKLRVLSKSSKSINWFQAVENSKVYELFSNYSVLCLCSTVAEMSSLLIQEAKKIGIPILASDFEGNREQIIHLKNGILYKRNNVSSLIESLKLIDNNQSMIKDLKHRNDFIEYNVLVEKHLEIYNKLNRNNYAFSSK